MNLIDAIILAIVQGATEFLPVSSSGHVALAGKLLGLAQAPLDFVIAIHFGTLLSVVAYYRRDLWAMVRAAAAWRPRGDAGSQEERDHRKLLWLLALGTVPAAVVGYLAEDAVDAAFGDLRMVGIALIFTAAILAAASRMRGEKRLRQTGWREAAAVGVAQVFALAPGVSRSGCTIVAGLGCGFHREWSPRFAFLLSVPVILGGSLLELLRIIGGEASGSFDALNYGVAVIVAGVVGYVSIRLVIDSVRRGNLLYFGAYCLVVGLVAIVLGPHLAG